MGLIGGILLSILGLVVAILTTVLARLITDDIKEWLPRIKERLIERAVRKLPGDQRERYAEEWSAFINETPGDLSKVINAFGLGFAADSIADVAGRTQGVARRAIDITVCSVMIILVAPLMLLIALIIKFESPGPVFVYQKHLGSDGKPFKLLSFRTMLHGGAEMELKDGLDSSEDTRSSDDLGHPNVDPRTTRIGTFIRRGAFNELPQLISVVRGELSLKQWWNLRWH